MPRLTLLVLVAIAGCGGPDAGRLHASVERRHPPVSAGGGGGADAGELAADGAVDAGGELLDAAVSADAAGGVGDAAEAEGVDAAGGVDVAGAADTADTAEVADSAEIGDASDSPDAAATSAGGVGTFADPILIAALPFSDSRDTSEAPSPVFDFYDCALETDEGGAGFVYRLEIEVAGALSVAVDDIAGDSVDVDVHLLSGASPDLCLIRDNIALTYPVEPGAYFIVVDTWVNGAGATLAGPYTLSVTFTSASDAGPADGTFINPIIINGFPFVDGRDSGDAPAARVDAYGCAPATNEGGGELVYRLTVASPGVLDVSLDEVPGDGVDIDVHLLASPDPSDCLARDDSGFQVQIEAATAYFIVADTWVDGAGVAQAGPFTITVDFAPDGPPPVGEGTLASPILVDALPFYDHRSTEDAVSSVLDAYACAPDTDESGAEFVYEIPVTHPGILAANIVDPYGDGVDVDIHLLSATSAAACLARDNSGVAVAVEPGTYFAVVDTWVDATGQALAGPYTLELSLSPAPDLEGSCVILYGDTRGRSSSDPQVAHQAVVAAIAARCPRPTLVHSGDIVRSGSSASDWERFVDIERPLVEQGASLYPIRGNHDGSWSNIRARLAALLNDSPDSSQYTRQLTDRLTLIVLDSEGDAATQAPWLEARLAEHPDPQHRFLVAFHRPLYPSIGGHSGWGSGEESWAPILADHAGRVLVVTGHNHAMSRELVAGVTYVTAGGGGAPLYGCTQAHAYTKACVDAHGYYACDASLTCVGYKLGASGAEVIFDAFTL